jgi:hypothetical protein
MIWLQQMRYFRERREAAEAAAAAEAEAVAGGERSFGGEESADAVPDYPDLSYLTFDSLPPPDAAAAAARERLANRITAMGVPLEKRPMPALMFDEIKEGLMAEPDGWWVDAKDFYGPDATKVGGGSGQELELTPQRRRLSEVEVDAAMPTSQDELNPIMLGVLQRAGGVEAIRARGERALLSERSILERLRRREQREQQQQQGPGRGSEGGGGGEGGGGVAEGSEEATPCVGLAGVEASALEMGPPFAWRLWAHMTSAMCDHAPDVLVFANAREASDLLLIQAAR